MKSSRLLIVSSLLTLTAVAVSLWPRKEQVTAAAESAAGYKSVLIRGVPHVRQKPDFCGEACAEMALRRLGHAYDQDAVFDRCGLTPLDGRGCYTRDLRVALQDIGFDIGPVWHKIRAAHANTDLRKLWADLHRDLAADIPSIVCTRYDEQPNTTEHFRLILGYDKTTDEIVYHEPAERDGGHRRMARSRLFSLWPLKYDEDTWTVVRFRLKPGGIKAARGATGFTAADYAQHMMQLKKKLPSKKFHVVLEKPFFVIGDEAAEAVERRAAGTIRWSVQKLKQDYFSRDPGEIIDIWLFKDKKSYDHHARSLFGDTPTTPYGYYSPAHRALVMNISTGGGTLVHEIVHPFVASNFPQCPSWFNEGLASLYEQSGERNGRIQGFTNWRLPGLQRSIRAGHVPSFDQLCSTTTREFYDDPRGTNYGQARYLCYYLQQQGKLREFYHAFRKNVSQDASGLKTLKAVLSEKDLAAFKKRWEAYVLKLRYR